MPLREFQCEVCGLVLEELVSPRDWPEMKQLADAGGLYHGDDVSHTLRRIASLTAKPCGDYPYTTAPWFLPPVRDANGQIHCQQVTVNSRAEYLQLCKKHHIAESDSYSDRLTMYDRRNHGIVVKDEDVVGDVKFFHEMINNADKRQEIIRKAAGHAV